VLENVGRHCCARIVGFRLFLVSWVVSELKALSLTVPCPCKFHDFPEFKSVLSYICNCIYTEWFLSFDA